VEASGPRGRQGPSSKSICRHKVYSTHGCFQGRHVWRNFDARLLVSNLASWETEVPPTVEALTYEPLPQLPSKANATIFRCHGVIRMLCQRAQGAQERPNKMPTPHTLSTSVRYTSSISRSDPISGRVLWVFVPHSILPFVLTIGTSKGRCQCQATVVLVKENSSMNA